MSNIIRVFIYDELMNEEVFREHGLNFRDKSSVTLSAYKRVFNKIPLDSGGQEELGMANVEPTHDNLGMLIGMMYEVEETLLSRFDEIYHHPTEYNRKVMTFQRHDFAQTRGIIYIALLEKTKPGLKPSKAMMKRYRGARKAFDMLQFSRLMNAKMPLPGR